MGKIRNYAATTFALCAVIAAMLLVQGCQKSASVPAKDGTSKQTASAGSVETGKSKPQSAPTGTADTAKTKKPSTAPRASDNTAFEPKQTPLPRADIDSHDSKYVEGKPPKIEASGKPVTVLYLPPHMFSIAMTRNGQENAYLTFGTITDSSDAGNKLEIHVLARLLKPDSSKFEKVALIYSDKTKKGQSWTASAAGMNFKIEALDYGEYADSPFPDSGMGWLKLRITAK